MDKIEKPIILAICGKSASGKDTLSIFLTNFLKSHGIPAHNVVSVTTRPPRDKEQSGKSYYFVNDEQFHYLIENNKLIEFTKFRNWYYGVPYQEIESDKINIGVFNPRGLENLRRQHIQFHVIPIYLEEKLITRLRRSHDREGKWKLEYLRRLIADHFAFKGIEKKLKALNNGNVIRLKNSSGV